MPESSGFGVVATGVATGGTLLGIITGAALSLIGKGRRDQKIDLILEDHSTKLTNLEGAGFKLEEHGKKLSSLEEAIRNLSASLASDGVSRFITVPACKEEQGHCRDLIAEKLASGNARFGVVEADIKEIKASQDVMKASQDANLRIILDEIRKNK